MFAGFSLKYVKMPILVLLVGLTVGGLSILGTDTYSIFGIVTVGLMLLALFYLKLKEGLILTITLICGFIPQINSAGLKINSVNISISDFVLLFNFVFLLITQKIKRIYTIYKDSPKFINVFFVMTILLLLYLLFSSYYNDFSLVLKIVRTLLYSFFVYMLIVVSYKEKNITNYIVFLSLAVSLDIIMTYRHVVISTGQYGLFRNSETFLSSSLCYLIMWMVCTKEKKWNKLFTFVAIVTLIGAIISEQDRVQIISVLGSMCLSILFLLIKKVLSLKKLFKIMFSVMFILGLIYCLVILINNNGINNMFQNYYNYRIAILFNNNGNLQLDSSLGFRQLEYQNIINSITQNVSSFFFGKGLGALYLGNLTVVDSFWFWVILNMGLIGTLFFIYFFFTPFKIIVQNNMPLKSSPIFAYFCATLIMTLTIPNMIYRVDDSVSMGIFFGLLHLVLKNSIEFGNGRVRKNEKVALDIQKNHV